MPSNFGLYSGHCNAMLLQWNSVTFLQKLLTFLVCLFQETINLVGNQLQTLLLGSSSNWFSSVTPQLSSLQSNSSLLLCVVQGSARDLEESIHRNQVSPTLVLSFPGSSPHCLMTTVTLNSILQFFRPEGLQVFQRRFRSHMVPTLHALRLDFILIGNILSSPISSERAMAPHSSTLAWKIPWMEEPGGLQSMGSLRVGHD